MLFAIAGMMLMATASDLLVIFLALEVLSLAVYVLTGIRRDSALGLSAPGLAAHTCLNRGETGPTVGTRAVRRR